MCAKCRANTALAKEMAKHAGFPDDPRTADEIWWSDEFDRDEADHWVRRAFDTIEGLKTQGFEIVEV